VNTANVSIKRVIICPLIMWFYGEVNGPALLRKTLRWE